MDKVKELGQVMTPCDIIEHMVDLLCLTDTQIENNLFLENSCGEGAFVKALIDRGVNPEHIFACDIDEEMVKKVQEILPESNVRCGSFFKQKDRRCSNILFRKQ